MDARLGLPSFSALCAILCGVHQGVDQRTSLLVLEQDMRTKEREALRRLMEKRPGRIKAASFILTLLLIFLFMVPLVILIIRSLQAVGF
jgi:ABC-type Fe3+ transport system permease subunit